MILVRNAKCFFPGGFKYWWDCRVEIANRNVDSGTKNGVRQYEKGFPWDYESLHHDRQGAHILFSRGRKLFLFVCPCTLVCRVTW